jgi:hypothetical protein
MQHVTAKNLARAIGQMTPLLARCDIETVDVLRKL